MKAPGLAIVVPFYKIDFFEETIQSIARQTDQRFRLYIGNDASPDDPLPLIQKYLNPDQYRYFNYDKNLGGVNLALQWERILENVEEEWFQILGDDDCIADNFVSSFYATQAHFSNVSLVKVASVVVNENNKALFSFTQNYKSGLYDALAFFYLKASGQMNSSLSEHIFLNKRFREINKFRKYPLAWHTDDMAILEMCNLGKFYFLAETQVSIKFFENSISGSDKHEALKHEAGVQFTKDVAALIDTQKHSWRDEWNFQVFLHNMNGLFGGNLAHEVNRKRGFRAKALFGLFSLIVKVKTRK